jgi:hypothetical protein
MGGMSERTFVIEWDEDDPAWMNTGNLLICLTETCPNTKWTVTDVTGDRLMNDQPMSQGPVGRPFWTHVGKNVNRDCPVHGPAAKVLDGFAQHECRHCDDGR